MKKQKAAHRWAAREMEMLQVAREVFLYPLL